MFCPRCSHSNLVNAERCAECGQGTAYFRERVFIGRQFIFVRADEQHPVALEVDGNVQTCRAPAILSRHQHSVSFGDAPLKDSEIKKLRRDARSGPAAKRRLLQAWPLPDQPRLPPPILSLLTVVTDRKIYQPNTDATLFIVAPDAAGSEAALEIQIAGQKVYEAQVTLNRDGLALHTYTDMKEGEYKALVTLPGAGRVVCTFSVAEYALSPLIAILEEHTYAQKRLTFGLNLLLLSVPYSGPVEFGLQCGACDDRVVDTQKVQAEGGTARGDFDVSGHGGPFHVQVTTPDGHTALVSFPGTGAMERKHIQINPLGQASEMGLLPWEDAQAVRGLYVGPGEVNMTPLMLESVHADKGRLQVAANVDAAQIVTFDPRAGTSQVIELTGLERGQALEFDVAAPYTLFTVGTVSGDESFEGWGIVIKPVQFEATLTAPKTARPGAEIDVDVEIASSSPAFCWLLVYDARLEHESPVPKLAKRIYESARDATSRMAAGTVPNARDWVWAPIEDGIFSRRTGATLGAAMAMPMGAPLSRSVPKGASLLKGAMQMFAARAPDTAVAVETPVLVVAPVRMDFPELAHVELFYMEGHAARTVKLGEQIGTWRARAYVFQGADYRELTADVQADKALYAELDLPAIASPGDDVVAAVNYNTREPANLVIATPFGETRAQVAGSGTEQFPIKGPGRVEVRIENQDGADWSIKDVAPPGVQRVTASRLAILDRGQTIRGERVVVYASLGQVLKDTITALIGYPFG